MVPWRGRLHVSSVVGPIEGAPWIGALEVSIGGTSLKRFPSWDPGRGSPERGPMEEVHCRGTPVVCVPRGAPLEASSPRGSTGWILGTGSPGGCSLKRVR